MKHPGVCCFRSGFGRHVGGCFETHRHTIVSPFCPDVHYLATWKNTSIQLTLTTLFKKMYLLISFIFERTSLNEGLSLGSSAPQHFSIRLCKPDGQRPLSTLGLKGGSSLLTTCPSISIF